MDLTTLARVKTLLAISASDDDTLLNQLITAVSSEVEKFLNRTATAATYTEQYDVDEGQRVFFLRAYPVTALTSIKVDILRSFTDAVAVDSSLYYADLARGKIKFDGYQPIPGPGVFQAVYTGGMAANAGAFVTAFPRVAQAVDMQVAYMFQRKAELAVSSKTWEGLSIVLESPMTLVKRVKDMLQYDRRSELASI